MEDYILIDTKPEDISLSNMNIGDTSRIVLSSIYGGETHLYITKTGEDSFSVYRKLFIQKDNYGVKND